MGADRLQAKLAQLALEARASQKQIAADVGVTASYLNHIIHGRKGLGRVDKMVALAEALGHEVELVSPEEAAVLAALRSPRGWLLRQLAEALPSMDKRDRDYIAILITSIIMRAISDEEEAG